MTVTLGEGYFDDWYVLLDERLQYVSDSCVEGSGEHWTAMLAALKERKSCWFKRCAVNFHPGHAEFYSPRNTMGRSWVCPDRDLPALIESIEAALSAKKETPTP